MRRIFLSQIISFIAEDTELCGSCLKNKTYFNLARKYLFLGFLKTAENQNMIQAWTEVCHQIFAG